MHLAVTEQGKDQRPTTSYSPRPSCPGRSPWAACVMCAAPRLWTERNVVTESWWKKKPLKKGGHFPPRGCIFLRKVVFPWWLHRNWWHPNSLSRRGQGFCPNRTWSSPQFSSPHATPWLSLCLLSFLPILWLPSTFLLLKEMLVTLLSFSLRAEPSPHRYSIYPPAWSPTLL